jgi:hypothetical protein
MSVSRKRPRDAGEGPVGYIAMIAILASILALSFTGVSTAITEGLGSALCRLITVSPCPWGHGPEPSDEEKIPCNADTMTTEHNENFQVVFYSHKDTRRSVVAVRSNGEIWETTGTDSKNGFDIEVGVGFSLKGKGASISAGGGMDWGAHSSTTWRFKNEKQRTEFHDAVERETMRIWNSEGWDGVEKLKEVPYKVADRMGVGYGTYYGESTTGFGNVSGSFAIVSGGGGVENAEEVGAMQNSDGTTIKTYKTNETYGINGGVGILIAEAGAQKDWANGSVISVFYDKNGKPTKAIITTDTGSSWDASASVGATWTPSRKKNGPPDQDGNPTDDGGPQGDKGGGPKWTPWQKGGGEQSTTQIHIPLTDDPHAQRVVDGLLNPSKAMFDNTYPGGMQGLTDDFDELVTDKGTIYNMSYDREASKDGFDVSGSFGVKLGGYENSTEQTRLKLTDAAIVDPVTGERKPWAGCRP